MPKAYIRGGERGEVGVDEGRHASRVAISYNRTLGVLTVHSIYLYTYIDIYMYIFIFVYIYIYINVYIYICFIT